MDQDGKTKVNLPSPWATSSPKEQGGLRLVAIQPTIPAEFSHLLNYENWPKNHKDNPNQFIWLESLTKENNELLNDFVRIRFGLVGKDGEFATIFRDIVDSNQNSNTVFALEVPPNPSPNYHGSELVAMDGAKVLGRWVIDGMPTPQKQIGDEEKAVLSGEANGMRVACVSSQPYRLYGNKAPNISFRHYFHTLAITDSKSGKPVDLSNYNILSKNTRSTWEAKPQQESLCQQVAGKVGQVLLSDGNQFLSDTKMMEYEITLQKFATYDEEIRIKNLSIERLVWDSNHPNTFSFITSNATAQDFETPSGVKLTIPAYDRANCSGQNWIGIGVQFPTGYKNLIIKASPLYKKYRKPVNIILFHPSFPQIGQSISSSSSDDFLTFGMVIRDPLRKGKWIEPSFPVVVRQKAIIEEGKVNLRLPVEHVKVSAKSPAKSLGGGKAKAP